MNKQQKTHKSQIFGAHKGVKKNSHQKTSTLPNAAVLLLNEILANNGMVNKKDYVSENKSDNGIKSVGQTPRYDQSKLSQTLIQHKIPTKT